MKLIIKAWENLKAYPFSILASIVYLTFCGMEISLGIRLKHMKEHHLSLGEGLMFGMIFLSFFAFVFFSMTLICYALKPRHKKFYGRLMMVIAFALLLTFIIIN